MPLDNTVKVGTEILLYLSSSSQSLLSIDLEGRATETAGIVWDEVGFYRHPIDASEPINIIDIYKGRLIDHTKKGLEQNKTLTLVAAFQNSGKALWRYKEKECLVKIQWHIDGIGGVNEYEYYNSVRFTEYTRAIPQEEVQERVTFRYSKYGHRDG